MPRYVIQHRYQSTRDGTLWGPYDAGQEIDLREDDAGWLERDSPGLLKPFTEPEPVPEPEPVEEPADTDDNQRDATATRDRMHRGGRRRTGA